MIKSLCLGLAAAILLSSCQVMNDSKAMRKSLDELKGKGDHIAKRADDLEREMKFKESTFMFEKSMSELFPKDSRMQLGETEMLNKAETAVLSMLFQFWKGDFFERSLEVLDADFELAMANQFSRIADLIHAEPQVDVMVPSYTYKGIGSLAARMERMQVPYVTSLRTRGLPDTLSFYELVCQALQDRDAIQQSGILPKAKTQILAWKGEAIHLLQMRHNYLPMMVLSRLSSFGQRGNLGRALFAALGEKIVLADSSKSIGPAQLKEWTHWLNMTLETRKRLRSLGIEPKYNQMFGTMLRSPDFGQKELSALTAAEVKTDLQRLQVDFARAYMAVVSEMMPSSSENKWGHFINSPLPAALSRDKVM